jgi:hypothetical protein
MDKLVFIFYQNLHTRFLLLSPRHDEDRFNGLCFFEKEMGQVQCFFFFSISEVDGYHVLWWNVKEFYFFLGW